MGSIFSLMVQLILMTGCSGRELSVQGHHVKLDTAQQVLTIQLPKLVRRTNLGNCMVRACCASY